MPVSFSKIVISSVLPAVKMEGIIMLSLSDVRPFAFMYALAPLIARASAVPPGGVCAEAADPATSRATVAAMDKNPKARFMSVLLIVISHRWAGELAAERDERPRRALRVPAEADVTGERVLVAEEPRDRIPVVDAVRARQRMQRVDGLGTELHRVGDVALEAQLLLDRRGATLPSDPLG